MLLDNFFLYNNNNNKLSHTCADKLTLLFRGLKLNSLLGENCATKKDYWLAVRHPSCEKTRGRLDIVKDGNGPPLNRQRWHQTGIIDLPFHEKLEWHWNLAEVLCIGNLRKLEKIGETWSNWKN